MTLEGEAYHAIGRFDLLASFHWQYVATTTYYSLGQFLPRQWGAGI